MIEPRCLTDEGMAAYLSIPVAEVQRLPVGRVLLGGRVRFDRVAVDRWLDGAPASAIVPSNENANPADEALAAFNARLPRAPSRRP